MIYEIEIVTFQKIPIRALVLMSVLYSSKGRKKDKTKTKGLNFESKFKFETHVINLFSCS